MTEIEPSTLRILNVQGQTIGTGFLVSKTLAVTCAHVVLTAGLDDGEARIRVQFTGQKQIIDVRAPDEFIDIERDVAILELASVPEGVQPLRLGLAAQCQPRSAFRSFGYATAAAVQGIHANGRIDGYLPDYKLLQLQSPQADHGISGAPVLDEKRGVVVGMITKGHEALGRNQETTFAIPAEILCELCPEELTLNYPASAVHMFLPSHKQILAHRQALANIARYRRWADESADESYLREVARFLPLLASPYDDPTGQQHEDLLQIVHLNDNLLVLSEPGMGKTVTLERAMWEISQETDSIWVPIFVPLLFFQGDLIECIRVALNETGELCFNDHETVQDFLREARCHIMFDGLNEVPGRLREQTVVVIADFLRDFPKHKYIITSRSQDDLWKKLRTSDMFEKIVVIQNITDEQVKAYLIAHLGNQRGQELYDRLNESLKSLSHMPLLLWLIKEAGKQGEELPGNRGELFDHFVDRVLRRDREKLEIQISSMVKKRALAHLAFVLQESHQLSCEWEQAREIVGQSEKIYNADDVLKESLVHGLLLGERQLRFLHQSVQEYFVGLLMREIAQTEKVSPIWRRVTQRLLHSNLVTRARDDWWAESFVQLAGLVYDPGWLVRELAVVNPWLAFWCSIEGKPIVDEKTQTLVEARTTDLLHSKRVQERLDVIRELARLKNPRTIKYLIQAFEDEDEGVVDEATKVLVELGEPAVESLKHALSDSRRTLE